MGPASVMEKSVPWEEPKARDFPVAGSWDLFVAGVGVVGEGGFVPLGVEGGAVGVGAGVGGEDGVAGVEDEGVFVEVAMASAVGAVFAAEPGGVFIGAALDDGVAGGGVVLGGACGEVAGGEGGDAEEHSEAVVAGGGGCGGVGFFGGFCGAGAAGVGDEGGVVGIVEAGEGEFVEVGVAGEGGVFGVVEVGQDGVGAGEEEGGVEHGFEFVGVEVDPVIYGGFGEGPEAFDGEEVVA